MIINRETATYLVGEADSIEVALRKISANRRRCVFVVTTDGKLVGSLTDGDFRRWLIASTTPSLEAPCSEMVNTNCVWISEISLGQESNELFGGGIDVVPVIDIAHHVVAIAEPRAKDFMIGGRAISVKSPSFIIAEIGINHNGSFSQALKLIDAAAEAGATCAKFQLRDIDSLYREGPGVDSEDLGAQYALDLIKENYLSVEDVLRALDHVTSAGLIPLCTPWDRKSAEILVDYGLPAFKVASADLTNHPLVQFLSSTGRPLVVSTGMSTEHEIFETVQVLQRGVSNFALLQCSSAYPAPNKDLNLAYMERLSEISGSHVGYSGHERGHHIAVAAVAMGARIIEKHITLDRGARGNDHRVSLEPSEFKLMISQIRDVEEAIGEAKPRTISQGESLNRLSLSKSLVAARDLEPGEILTTNDIDIKSPGRGLQPNTLPQLLGVSLKRRMHQGDFFYLTDIQGTRPQARAYKFNRPWGLPVRFHDWRSLSEISNPDFLEFHLSYRDLDIDVDKALASKMPFGLVVHSPDLFTGDLILDLASSHDEIRERSIHELQRVINLTRSITPKFTMTREPIIVASLGGSTLEQPISRSEKQNMYGRIYDSIQMLNTAEVNLVAQTLPPFPWYLGGQRHCNLFVDPHETAQFSVEVGMKICLDIAHTKLATNQSQTSFSEATRALLPHTAHLHLVDAAGKDDEGLQILEGEVDWSVLALQLAELAPGVSFIPEIWQGHVDGGSGFWTALDRLEDLLSADR